MPPRLPLLPLPPLPPPQELVGGSAAFEPFFRAYIQRFSGAPLTSEDFRAFFCEHFQGVEAIGQVDWDTWLYKPGAEMGGEEWEKWAGWLLSCNPPRPYPPPPGHAQRRCRALTRPALPCSAATPHCPLQACLR